MDEKNYKVTDKDLAQLKGMLDTIELSNFNGTFTTKIKITLLITIILDNMIKRGEITIEDETGLVRVNHDVLSAIGFIRAPDGLVGTEILR